MDDLDKIMTVMQAAFDPAFGEAWTRRQVEDALALPGTHYLLANSRGEAPQPGEIVAGFTMSRSVLDETELLLIAVHPDFRNRGIATRLINRFAYEAYQQGARRLFLEMRETNPAEALYLRMDFHKIGRRKNYYRRGAGDPVDAITFAREIDESVLTSD
ncbi:ribosomal-protein-alanine N-acetyltransferase [Croceibacterium atlanticum]|uniref:Ribosomal-protein-alanine N-acetyltransferase n=2 Tax=Croceibacterium atlanticum TaxID=1267766 RepID=A0A0F7KSL4_9SPHN|nr:ribosomal-protein-alanine N-acetyltransferase [Croceibacterium atlanticum]